MIKFRDLAAENWLRRKSASFLERALMRLRSQAQDHVIADGLQQGHNPRKVGLHLAGKISRETGKREGGIISLDDAEFAILSDFESCLQSLSDTYFDFDLRDKRFDRSMRRSIREKTPIPSEKIGEIVNRFEVKLLKRKADMIAQTEMIAALNRSEWLSIKAAFEKHRRPENALTRIWDSCGDDRVRPSHQALDGQSIVGFETCFVSPLTGAKMMYPGDVSLGAPEAEVSGCRCRVRYEIDFLARL